MGEGNQIYAVNDNVHFDKNGLEDRTGFNSFLKAARIEKYTKMHALLKQGALENDNYPPNPTYTGLTYISAIFLGLCTLVAIYGLIATTSPALHIVSQGVLIAVAIIASAVSTLKGRERFQAFGLCAGIIMSIGLMIIIGEYFSVTPLQMSSGSFWIMAAGISLAVGALLTSRVALIMSITSTALWGYGYLSGNLSVSLAVIAFPVIAICQILLSTHLADSIGKFASVLMLCVWGGTVLSIAYANGFLIIPMIASGLILGFGALYVSKAHMLDAWTPVKQKPTYPLVWLLLMGSSLLAVLWLSSPELFPIIERTTPLTHTIWQFGLVGGGLLISALSFTGQSRQSYSFARRIMSSIVIISIASALYYQTDIEARLAQGLAAEIKLLIYTGALGILTLLTAIKFTSAIKNGYILWLMASSFIFVGVFLAATQLESWSLEMVAVSVLAGMVTLCAIAWTQKEVTQPTSIYRPLSTRDKKRLGPTQKYSYYDTDLNIGRMP